MTLINKTTLLLVCVVYQCSGQSETLLQTVTRLSKEIDALKASKGILAPQSGVTFGEGFVRMLNTTGRSVAYLGETTSHNGTLALSDSKGYVLTQVGIATAGNGGAINLLNTSGKEILTAGAGQNGSGVLTLRDSQEMELLYLGQTMAGGGGFATFNNGATQVAKIGWCEDRKAGCLIVNGHQIADVAEVFDLKSRAGVEPGTVMSESPAGDGLVPSSAPYDPRVVGVVSGAGGLNPGLSLGSRADDTSDLPVALSGQVYVRICLEGGPVSVGDLVVASSRPGVAMRAADRSRSLGAVVGKVLEPYSSTGEEGLVRILVMAR